MNIIKRIKAPTPKKYKRWGRVFKRISVALVAGVLALNSVNMTVPENMNVVVATVIFFTTVVSTLCYAQVEKE